MELRTLFPSLPDNVLEGLEAAGITTFNDILFTPTSQVLQQLSAGVLSIFEIEEIKAKVAERVSPPATRGDELFTQEHIREETCQLCTCGVEELDELLGGFGTYGVIEIAGDKNSGKTGLVLQIVLRHLASFPYATVTWLDTGGEFQIERAAEILNLNDGTGAESALDRLSIISCFDVATAHQAVEELRVSFESQRDGPQRTRFLVIDPITLLFASLLSATSSQGHAVMLTFMRQLGSLARAYSLTVLITNNSVKSLPTNAYSAFTTTITKPALGPSFTFLTDETIWLSNAKESLFPGRNDGNENVFIAEVFRSRSRLSKTWCAFVIRNGASFERFELPKS